MSRTLLLLCCFIQSFYVFSVDKPRSAFNNTNVHRVKRIPGFAIDTLVTTTSNLVSAYRNGELDELSGVARTVLSSIPILGNFFHQKDNEFTKIAENLARIEKEVGKVKAGLSKKIDLSVIQKQIGEDQRWITDCYQNLLLFLKKPNARAEQDRIKKCYRFTYVRDIGNVMNNKVMSVKQEGLFSMLIDDKGSCSKEEIDEVFRYLLGLYIEGCTAVEVAEALIYNGTSSTFKDECETTINENFTTVYKKCSEKPCGYSHAIKEIVKKWVHYHVTIRVKLQEAFPWFYFVVMVFKDRSLNSNYYRSVNSNSYRSYSNSYRSLNSNSHGDDIKFYRIQAVRYNASSKSEVVVLWSDRVNTKKYSYNLYKYGVAYNTDRKRLYWSFNGMKLVEEENDYLSKIRGIYGYYSYSDKPNFCDENHNSESKTSDNNSSLGPIILYVFLAFMVLAVVAGGYAYVRNRLG